MAFRTNYKDEIATKIYQIVDAVGNAIIHEKVRLNPNYKPTQAGDKFGAAEVNAIHKRLNDLDDGTVKAKKAETADDSSKVNGHTVNADVPENAKFTDTVYAHPTSAGNKHIPAGGGANQVLKYSSAGTAVWASIVWAMIANGALKNVAKGAFVTNTGGSNMVTINTGLSGDNVVLIPVNGDWQAAMFGFIKWARVGSNNPNFYAFMDSNPTQNIRVAWIAFEI